MKITTFASAVTLLFFVVTGCDKNEVQAEQSLVGTWLVVSVHTEYGEFKNNTFVQNNSKTEQGTLGIFDFGQSEVTYNFTGNGTWYNRKAAWELEYKKVNSGFIRVPQFTLVIQDGLRFDVFFDDGTKNAEKGATKARLTQIPSEGEKESITLELEKK